MTASQPRAPKRKFVAIGEIQNSQTLFEIHRYAYTETQFRMLVFRALKKKYPRLSFTNASLVKRNTPEGTYVPYVVRDITNVAPDRVATFVKFIKNPSLR